MKNVKIFPRKLSGLMVGPGSKSMSHRAIIAAALSKGVSRIDNVMYSDDVKATLQGVEALGAKVSYFDHYVLIDGSTMFSKQNPTIDCVESGSTLRFMVAVGLATKNTIRYVGKGLLGQRPLQPFYDIFDQYDISYSKKEGALDLEISGVFKPGEYILPGDVSSQFITGLLYALPLLDGDSVIKLSTHLESGDYVTMTLDMLKRYGIVIEQLEGSYYIKGNQTYKPCDYFIEGDYSQLAFYSVAASLGCDIQVSHMDKSSSQGDKAMLDVINKMGVQVSYQDDTISYHVDTLKGVEANCSEMPDVVPVLSLLCSVAKGKSVLSGLERLKYKECDRLYATYDLLNQLGANIQIVDDTLVFEGVEQLQGGITLSSYDDHRMCMMLAMASIVCKEPIVIDRPHCVSKSYPSFFDDFKRLGGHFDECDMEK